MAAVAEDRARLGGRATAVEPQALASSVAEKANCSIGHQSRRRGAAPRPATSPKRSTAAANSERSIVPGPATTMALPSSSRPRRKRADWMVTSPLPVELVRKMIAHQAAEVQLDQLPGDFALPAVGRFVGPDVAAEAAARPQRLQLAEAHRQHVARQLAAAGVQLEAAGRRRHLAVADDADAGRLGRVGARQAEMELGVRPARQVLDRPFHVGQRLRVVGRPQASASAAESCTSASNGPQEPSSVRCKHCQIRSSEAASTSGCEAVISQRGPALALRVGLLLPGDLQQPAAEDRLAGLGIGQLRAVRRARPGPEVLQAAELHVQAELPAELLGLPPGRSPADAGSGTSRRPAASAARPAAESRRRTAGGGLYREVGTSLFTGNDE